MALKISKSRLFRISLLLLTFLVFVNAINFVNFDKQPTLILNQNLESTLGGSSYTYSTNNIGRMTFVAELTEDQHKSVEILGTYELNSSLNYNNIELLNILNKFSGRKMSDTGHIELEIIPNDNSIFIDCNSISNKSTAIALSKVNLFDNISFEDYNLSYIKYQDLNYLNSYGDITTYTLIEGNNLYNSSTLKLYFVYG